LKLQILPYRFGIHLYSDTAILTGEDMQTSLRKAYIHAASITALLAMLVTNTASAADRVKLTTRCRAIAGTCSRGEVLEIGRKTEALYVQKYKKKPPQDKSGTNIYGTEHLPLIDRAIRQVKL